MFKIQKSDLEIAYNNAVSRAASVPELEKCKSEAANDLRKLVDFLNQNIVARDGLSKNFTLIEEDSCGGLNIVRNRTRIAILNVEISEEGGIVYKSEWDASTPTKEEAYRLVFARILKTLNLNELKALKENDIDNKIISITEAPYPSNQKKGFFSRWLPK